MLIVMAPITKGMREVADNSGEYVNDIPGASFPRVQIVTVANLLAHKKPQMPTAILPYGQARTRGREQLSLV